ncbi:uncharacterized protein LOC119722077 [Patiria miniata]|uniref:Uncharacterized protein n=1 Tax=Patiria miniata TaxID=46514 RepID=A0A913Z893_PATMI|nr:uncharacterized protein LOC119722077 [Patiria miniata]XP_038048018.1 uncharacterized protein LOC119722077 [Patiria miniata]XP_038048019.1 uncharacterized protein LOC119722077 [Patiria miniata]XP_038048020.1 uncharacterized protein LOC119722077 [Patiria miniata]
MTDVDVQFYGSHHLHLNPFDKMPDVEDEVRNIAGSLIAGQTDSADFESEIVRCQERSYFEGLLDGDAPEISTAFYAKEDGPQNGTSPDDSSHSSEEAKLSQPVVRVQGNGIPASYEVRGLRQHEMPVIGMQIDPRIMPGFRYRVRILSGDSTEMTQETPRYQFRGEPLHLLRIGQGYGKRLTFTSESLNDNTNFFWSDTNPSGYGFGIVAVQTGDEMVLTDLARRPIGTGTVEEASPCQLELGTETLDDRDTGKKALVKRVSVIMKVRLRYTCERHGIRSIRASETVIVRGVAQVIKRSGESKAYTKCIEQLELPHLGECLLYLS